MEKKLIINADDFGLCAGVNDAVAKAHSQGVLTSATLMVNMPGAHQAVDIAKQQPGLGVGVHLNLLEGKAVSDVAEIETIVDSDGNFKYSAGQLAIMSVLSGKVRRAIETELCSQIQWLISAGITPTHLDSHKHFHCCPAIYKIVCRLAERFGIAAVRWPWEPGTVCFGNWPRVSAKDKRRAFIVRSLAKRCQSIDSNHIKNDIFFGLAHTGEIDENFWAELSKTQFAGVGEVMTHPGYADQIDSSSTRLVAQRQVELDWLCADSTKNALAKGQIELIHYGQITGKSNE